MSDWSYAQYMLSMLHHGWGNSFFDIQYESIDTFIRCLKKLSCLDDYKSPNCAIQIAGQKKGKKSNQNRARGTSTWPGVSRRDISGEEIIAKHHGYKHCISNTVYSNCTTNCGM